MARPKRPAQELRNLDECSEAMRLLLQATTTREIAEAEQAEAAASATARFEGEINGARAAEAELRAQLQQYYMTHLVDIERDGRRSVQLANGVMGRRKSPPALKPRNRTFTWHAIKVLLRTHFGDKYFHKPKDPDVDKDLVKAELDEAALAKCGLKLDQDEEFYAEPFRPPQEG